jgi:hypothetical protein
VSDWRSVETAPRDKRLILTYGPDGIRIAIWLSLGKDWEAYYEGGLLNPTHWMPLPPAPPPEERRP